MFLKSCKGRKSCLTPIPPRKDFIENFQQMFFSCFHLFIIIDEIFSRHNPTFLQHFFSTTIVVVVVIVVIIMTRNELEILKISKNLIFPKTPKTDHPKKVDFGPFSTSLYTPIHRLFRDGAKMVIFEGSRPQNRKKALFCKKT